jgi:hypothetical protein
MSQRTRLDRLGSVFRGGERGTRPGVGRVLDTKPRLKPTLSHRPRVRQASNCPLSPVISVEPPSH